MNNKKIIAYQGSSGSYSEELLKKESSQNETKSLDQSAEDFVLKQIKKN